jgi:hypothetical protein
MIGSRFNWLEACLGVVLVGTVGAELLIYSPPGQGAVQSLGFSVESVSVKGQSTTLKVGVRHSGSDSVLQMSAFPIGDRISRQPAVYVFDDSDYPTANTVPNVAETVLYHLAGELTVRRYGPSIKGVTASGLKDVLMNTGDASRRSVIMVTGVMPAMVFSRGTDLVTPWIEAGGLLIWGGATIGYWSADVGRSLSASVALSLRENGTDLLLGVGVVRYPSAIGRTAEVRGDFAAALGISYQLTGAGVLRDSVAGRGGLLLGWYSSLFSSVSYVARGKGGYVIFGGEIQDGEALSLDVARILLAGATSASGQVATRAISLSGAPSVSDFVWDLPFQLTTGGIVVLGYDPNPDAVFYHRQLITS